MPSGVHLNTFNDYVQLDVSDVYNILCVRLMTLLWHTCILCRRLAATLTIPLYILFRKSVNSGRMPSIWINSYFITVHEHGFKTIVSSYRLVSLTTLACRVLESLLKTLLSKLWKEEIISHYQFDFKSNLTQLLSYFDSWTRVVNRHKVVRMIYIIFKKASDKASHSKLTAILNNFGSVVVLYLGWVISLAIGLSSYELKKHFQAAVTSFRSVSR